MMLTTVDFKGLSVTDIILRVGHKEIYHIQNIDEAVDILQGLKHGDFLLIRWVGRLKFDFAVELKRTHKSGDWLTEMILWCERVGKSDADVGVKEHAASTANQV